MLIIILNNQKALNVFWHRLKVYSEKIKKRIRGLFDLMLSDNKKARTEDYHGKYSMIKCEGQPCNSQEMLYQEAYDRAAIKTENKVVE